jgi:S-adenosylmethionine decarboxylase
MESAGNSEFCWRTESSVKKEIEFGYGPHLMLDLFGCDKDKLSDINFVLDLLNTFPDKMKMAKITPPHVFKYEGKSPEEGGISGVVLVGESHISVHTFPDKKHAFIDIFSRDDFDADYARSELLGIFKATHDTAKLLNRGLGHPEDIQPAPGVN